MHAPEAKIRNCPPPVLTWLKNDARAVFGVDDVIDEIGVRV